MQENYDLALFIERILNASNPYSLTFETMLTLLVFTIADLTSLGYIFVQKKRQKDKLNMHIMDANSFAFISVPEKGQAIKYKLTFEIENQSDKPVYCSVTIKLLSFLKYNTIREYECFGKRRTEQIAKKAMNPLKIEHSVPRQFTIDWLEDDRYRAYLISKLPMKMLLVTLQIYVDDTENGYMRISLPINNGTD